MRLYNSIKNNQHQSHLHRFRLNLLVALLITLSFLLILRLAYLQLAQYKRFATLSLKNQMSITTIAPPRGVIYDKNGVILAENKPVYALEIIPERIKNLKKTLQQLQALIPSITDEDIDNFKRMRKQNRSYTPIPFKLKLSQEEVAVFASNQHLFPGISIKARLMRHYPLKETTAHLLGYVGRINLQELQNLDSANYRSTNFIGKSGIEKYYEEVLHGKVGYQQIETDVSGRTLRIFSKQNPVSGAKLYLTIDARLQQASFNAMKDNSGSIVVINVQNGNILAMTSMPSFDPNIFVNGVSNKDYQKLLKASDNPLYNRAVKGLYPPASTIKPYIALAGLEKGAITPSTKIYDPGWYRLPGISHQYRDWKRGGHGVMNLKRALTVSCDTYFYQLGNKIGISAIEDTLSQFGFGQLTHVDLYEEAPGIVPSPSWKKRSRHTSWYPGDTLITAIGQGFMLASPLQMASATAALSLRGKRFRPHLFQKSEHDLEGNKIYNPVEEYPIQLKDGSYWDRITESMRNVITSKEGTGHRFGRNAPYSVAAKTGTAQIQSNSQYEKKKYTEIPKELRDHSLFIAFAPVENPQIAIAVLVENNFTASAIARKVMDAYFDLNSQESPS